MLIKKATYKLTECSSTNTLWCIGNKIFGINLAKNRLTNVILSDLKNPNQLFIDVSNDYMIIKNTTAEIAVYDKDFKLIWRNSFAKNSNTDYDFVYCEQSMTCYVLTTNAGLENLIAINIEHQQVKTYPLPKSEDCFYSLIKVLNDDYYFVKSNRGGIGKIKESAYVRHEIIDDKLVEKDVLFKTNTDLISCKKLTERYVYTQEVVYDLQTQKAHDFSDLVLKDTIIYDIVLFNNIFFLITSKKIIITEDFRQVKEVIEGKYLSSYYENSVYRYIGSWEHIKIDHL